MLDEAGMRDCKIMASNSLDEYIIRDLLLQGAQVDSFGVGENMITSKSDPVFGGVYKLAAVEKDGVLVPKIKISETIEKITTPCFKNVYRFYNRETGQAIADYVTVRGETVDDTQPITIFDPVAPGSAKQSAIFVRNASWCRYSKRADAFTTCLRSAISVPTVPHRLTVCGMR